MGRVEKNPVLRGQVYSPSDLSVPPSGIDRPVSSSAEVDQALLLVVKDVFLAEVGKVLERDPRRFLGRVPQTAVHARHTNLRGRSTRLPWDKLEAVGLMEPPNGGDNHPSVSPGGALVLVVYSHPDVCGSHLTNGNASKQLGKVARAISHLMVGFLDGGSGSEVSYLGVYFRECLDSYRDAGSNLLCQCSTCQEYEARKPR